MNKPVVTEVKRKEDSFPQEESDNYPMNTPVVIVDTEKDGTKPK